MKRGIIDFAELDRLTKAKNEFDAEEVKYREWAYIVLHLADELIALSKKAPAWRCANKDKPEPSRLVQVFPAPPSDFADGAEVHSDGIWYYQHYDEGAGWHCRKWAPGPLYWMPYPDPPQ